MAMLRIERGEKAPYELELGAEDFDIGRGADNALHFRDPWLSRVHARIQWLRERHYLEDLASRNGTYLNGAKMESRQALAHGDSIVLGDIELRYLESASGSIRALDSRSPFASDSTVMLSTDELVFERYREPEASGDTNIGESLLPSLNAAAAALISHYPLEELVERILRLVQEAVSAERGALLLKPRGGDGELEVSSFHGFASGDEVSVSSTITEQVLERKKAILTLDAQTDERFDAALSLQLEGVRSLICVPLWNNREVSGLVYLDQRISGRSFSARDLRLVGLIANMAAVKIENAYLLEEQIEKRRMEDQLAVGAKIQRKLLPAESPSVEGYDIRGATRSCFEIGGDYYDFIPLGGGKLAVVIGDVAGKGVGAALLMAVLQASLRALVHTMEGPAELVEKLNRVLLDNSPANRFATLFYAELDASSNTLEYVSGGHNPALLATDDDLQELMPTGPIVGLVTEASYTSRRVELPPASTLLLYTDGITELMAPSQEEFGTERLEALLRDNLVGSADSLLRVIGREMTAFSEGISFDDDSTAVVVRRLSID
ncbi:MAG: SpoIIE family protein phosphatase [bacterium]|nr:SpoIIE family protein phosphatase [bacterium]